MIQKRSSETRNRYCTVWIVLYIVLVIEPCRLCSVVCFYYSCETESWIMAVLYINIQWTNIRRYTKYTFY